MCTDMEEEEEEEEEKASKLARLCVFVCECACAERVCGRQGGG